MSKKNTLVLLVFAAIAAAIFLPRSEIKDVESQNENSKHIPASARTTVTSANEDFITESELSTSDRAQWIEYINNKTAYEQLSEANKNRAEKKKAQAYAAKNLERREKLQALDIAEGRNAEVREREADLKRRSESLYQGMTQARLLEVMGKPSSSEKYPDTDPKKTNTVFMYSPHPTGKIHYSIGDSFQYLEVWYNEANDTVIKWRWKTPWATL